MNNKQYHYIYLFFLSAVTVIFMYMLWPFAYPVFWAVIIAGIFHPIYKKILSRFKNANISGTLTLVVVFIIIFIPLSLVTAFLVAESLQLYSEIGNSSSDIKTAFQNIIGWIKNNPYLSVLPVNEQFLMDKFSEALRTIAEIIYNNTKIFTQDFFSFMFKFVLMFYSLFFFLRDGEKTLQSLMHLYPLGVQYEKIFYEKFTSTASITLKSILIIGVLQGALGAILFWLTGVGGAVIWGLIMAIASILPPFGTGVIWAPVGIFLLFTGKVWQGTIILAFGFLVISTIDNLLRPFLIGKKTSMHPVIVLFSTLGGMLLFGISGLLIGPIIASFFIAVWEMYIHYYQEELCKLD